MVLLEIIQHAHHRALASSLAQGWARDLPVSLLSYYIHKKITWGSRQGLSQVLKQHLPGYVTEPLNSF